MTLSVRVVKLIAGWFGRLSPGGRRRTAAVLRFILSRVIRYHRQDAYDALRRSFPDKSDAWIRGVIHEMYGHLAMNVVECLGMVEGDPEELLKTVQFIGMEHVDTLLEQGQGCLVMTGHLGNWELALSAYSARIHSAHVISKTLRQSALNDYLMKSRERVRIQVLPAHNSLRDCIRALRKNGIIGFVIDQNMIDKEGIFVEFFGRPACTTPGLAILSSRTKTPVVPLNMYRDADGTHYAEFLPPIEPPPDIKQETVTLYTQRYTAVLEELIRKRPAQWIWIHRRWKTQPPVQPSA